MQMIIEARKAPFARASRKSTHGPLDEDRALRRGIDAMVGITQPQPIVYGGKLLAFAKGEQLSREVRWRRPRYGETWHCGFASYDDLISEVTGNSKKYRNEWNKVFTTAGVANNYYDLWPVSGAPAAGAYGGAAFTAVSKTDATLGSIFHGGNVSTDTKHLLSWYAKASANTPTIYLYDRVLTYEACTFNANSNQAFTNTVPATRYIAASEGGLKPLFTCQTALGATAANITQLQYTDQDGNTLQSMATSTTVAHIVSAAAPTANLGARVVAPATLAATLPWGPHIPLAVGDGGVRLVANWTTSAANTGTLCIVLQRILAVIPCPTAGVASLANLIQEIPSMERVVDGACLSLMAYLPATTAFTGDGGIEFAWG